MKEWQYANDTPFIPVILLGKHRNLRELALVDTGARLCVIHEKYVESLNLDKIDNSYTTAFGNRDKIPVDICILSLDIEGMIENIECIVIKGRQYPDALPRVVLGRNFLNKFKVTLNGPNKKLSLE